MGVSGGVSEGRTMSTSGKRLLLVDDDPSAIHAMSRMLGHYPHQRFATSGSDALRLAREAAPDLILLDADLPGMTGLDVCEELQADESLACIPVIFASSHTSAEFEVSALERGAVDFVAKPLVAAQLVARARAQLRTRQLIEELKLDHLATTVAPSLRMGRPRLLVVDDDVVAIRVLLRTLSELGDIHFATSPSDARRLTRELQPDLILLDVHMPKVDGFSLCPRLKEDLGTRRHVPIVFVTRFSDPRTEMRALDLGAADFIAKSYRPSVLLARLRKLLALKLRTDDELHAIGEQWRRLGDGRVADIVGSASDAILSFDADGVVVLANAAAGRLCDHPHGGLVGRPIQALLGCAAGDLVQLAPQRARLLVPRAHSMSLPAEVSLSWLGEGRDRLTTVMLRDVSDRERCDAEARARAEAEAASRAKTQVLSYIAHEVGNPLNGLLGFSELMAIDSTHPLPEVQAKRLEHVMASGRRLRDLMRDVLDLSRSEAGTLTVRRVPVQLLACVTEAAEAVSEQARLAGIAITLAPMDATPHVLGDAGRLHQCLLNLLTNAVKYNRRGGAVAVGVMADATEIGISVKDNGIGLTAEQCQHLFEPFNRLGRQAGGAPGAGIGLVITRQLVEAMQGRIEVASSPAAGTVFRIVLERAPMDAHPPNELAHVSAQSVEDPRTGGRDDHR